MKSEEKNAKNVKKYRFQHIIIPERPLFGGDFTSQIGVCSAILQTMSKKGTFWDISAIPQNRPKLGLHRPQTSLYL
jgi:hypothetical protein